ncbi:MAG: hypothetical protein ACLQUY_22815 [Ktedonobacterales bacterium]
MLAGEGSTAQAVPIGELVGLAPTLQLASHHGHVRMAVAAWRSAAWWVQTCQTMT